MVVKEQTEMLMHHVAAWQAVLILLFAFKSISHTDCFPSAEGFVLQDSISCLRAFLKCNLLNSMLKDDFWGALLGIDSLSCVLTLAETQIWHVTNTCFVQGKKFQNGTRMLILERWYHCVFYLILKHNFKQSLVNLQFELPI